MFGIKTITVRYTDGTEYEHTGFDETNLHAFLAQIIENYDKQGRSWRDMVEDSEKVMENIRAGRAGEAISEYREAYRDCESLVQAKNTIYRYLFHSFEHGRLVDVYSNATGISRDVYEQWKRNRP